MGDKRHGPIPGPIFKAPEYDENGDFIPLSQLNRNRCPKGYHLVHEHFRNMPGESSMAQEIDGAFVHEYCAKNPIRR